MPTPTGPSDKNIRKLARMLWKTKRPVYQVISKNLMKPRRTHRVEANLHRIDKKTKEGDTIIVPGKVLGQGEISHKITIAALSASESALKKLQGAKCEYIKIETLVERNPEGKGVKIFF
ncbi:MAG: 50S ribosomal protein L18e [Promethearchaeota archaeon]